MYQPNKIFSSKTVILREKQIRIYREYVYQPNENFSSKTVILREKHIGIYRDCTNQIKILAQKPQYSEKNRLEFTGSVPTK